MITFKNCTSTSYAQRTIINAKSSDITFAFALDFNTAGEKLTKNNVRSNNKVYIPVTLSNILFYEGRFDRIYEIVNLFKKDDIIINIAGNGIYTLKNIISQKELDLFIFNFLKLLIENCNNKTFKIRCGGQTGSDESGAKAGDKLGLETMILSTKDWKYRDINGIDICDEIKFKKRFL